MQVDSSDVRVCQECGADVVVAVTPRKSKGEPVSIMVEVDEVEAHQLPIDVDHQWTLSKSSLTGKFAAGQAATRNQRAGMISAGVGFHQEHTRTKCKIRRESRR